MSVHLVFHSVLAFGPCKSDRPYLPDHSTKDMTLIHLKLQPPSNASRRKAREAYLIHRDHTLEPSGMNQRNERWLFKTDLFLTSFYFIYYYHYYFFVFYLFFIVFYFFNSFYFFFFKKKLEVLYTFICICNLIQWNPDTTILDITISPV